MGFENISPKKDAEYSLDNSKMEQEIGFLRKVISSLTNRLKKVTGKAVDNGEGEDLQNNRDNNRGNDNHNNRKKLTRRDLLKAGGAATALLAGSKVVDMLGIGRKDYGEGLSDWEFGFYANDESEESDNKNGIVVPEEEQDVIIKKDTAEKQEEEKRKQETKEQKEIRKLNEEAIAKVLEKQFMATGRISISLNIKKMIWEYWFNQYRSGGRQAFGLEIALNRMAPYYKEIKEVFKRVSQETGVNIPEEFIYLAIPESHCNADIGSLAGARGFYQLMPGAAKEGGLQVDRLVDERLNPIRNAEGAARYLVDLYVNHVGILKEEWREDEEELRWKLVLARYNGGKYFNRFKAEVKAGKRQVSYADYLKSREEAINDYVKEVFARGYFETRVRSVDEFIGILRDYKLSNREVKYLNGSMSDVKKRIEKNKKIKLPVFREAFQCEVVPGDTIYEIAKRYGISQEDIKLQNNLKDDNIFPGQILSIKISKNIYRRKMNSAGLFFEVDLQSALENLNYPEKFFAIIEVMKRENLFLTDEDDREYKSVKSGIIKRIKNKKLITVRPEKRKQRIDG